MTTRNHNKFRPYDPTQAKVGDVVLTPNPTARGEVVAVSLKEVVFVWEDDIFTILDRKQGHVLRQPPLAWLGSDPVYAGDTLWIVNESHTAFGIPYVIAGKAKRTLTCSSPADVAIYVDDKGEVSPCAIWSLTKPEPKPRFIDINGHKVPEPLRVAPAYDTRYYVPDLVSNILFSAYLWQDDDFDNCWLKLGFVHLTKEAAISHAQALLSFTKVSSAVI